MHGATYGDSSHGHQILPDTIHVPGNLENGGHDHEANADQIAQPESIAHGRALEDKIVEYDGGKREDNVRGGYVEHNGRARETLLKVIGSKDETVVGQQESNASQ